MNRTYLKSTLLLGVLAGVATASAQSAPTIYPFPPPGWISASPYGPCLKPPPNTTSPYGTGYEYQTDWNDLFGSFMGVNSTGNFDYLCFGPAVTLNIQGRIGFFTGGRGSAQDEVYPIGAPVNNYIDSWLYLTMGDPDAVAGNWGYADTVEQTGSTTSGGGGTTTTTRTPFGKNAIDTTYYGASDRYYVGESTNGDIRVILRTDILGDATRLSWRLINTTTATISIGLEFGQWVRFLQGTQLTSPLYPYQYLVTPITGDPELPVDPDVNIGASAWVSVPGYRPLIVDSRFATNPSAVAVPAPAPVANQMPPYVIFGLSQQFAYGLRLPTMPTTAIPDQTPIDIIDVGKAGFLLGLVDAQDEPMPAYNADPAPLLADTSFTGEAAYVERWLPQSVQANQGERDIVSYYQSTWSSSDYSPPYSGVLDGPNLLSLNKSDLNQYNTNPMIIRVYVDNTRGFSTVNEGVPLEDVQVQLNLPAGFVDANDGKSTTITQYIAQVPPTTHTLSPLGYPLNTPMSYVDFEVVADPGSLPPGTIPQQAVWTNTPPPLVLSGNYSYTVTITPNPGPAKTITGSINVATRPELNIANTASLIATPWSFGNNSWTSLFEANTNSDTGVTQPTLTQNVDFQVYYWDPLQQTYVGSSGPQRGLGYWVIVQPSTLANATANFLSDRNLNTPDATPTEPSDLGTGSVLVDVQPGWNLIANPYDYGIPVGQLVGVSAADPTTAQTYSQLATQGLIGSALAYWDNNNQSYQFTTSFDDMLQPNTGYWVYVSSPQKITLSFPPVTAPFLPVTTTTVFIKKSNQQKASMPTASWALNLTVQSGKSIDKKNTVGVVANPTLTKLATIMKPPVAPLSNVVSGAVVQASGTKTMLLAQSLVPNATNLAWNWQVFNRTGGGTKVTWPNISSVPSSLSVKLVDLATGRATDMRAESYYTYVAAANANHPFQIVVSPAVYTGPILGNVTAAISGPNVKAPFNINYQLDVAASTTIKVFKGVQLVDTVISGESDTVGNHTVQWNQKNTSGQYVGTGVYTIQVTGGITGRSDVKSVSIFVNR